MTALLVLVPLACFAALLFAVALGRASKDADRAARRFGPGGLR